MLASGEGDETLKTMKEKGNLLFIPDAG